MTRNIKSGDTNGENPHIASENGNILGNAFDPKHSALFLTVLMLYA